MALRRPQNCYYHGTRVANLPSISKSGLVPKPFVWLARQFKVAAHWAESRSGEWVNATEHVTHPHTVLRICEVQAVQQDPNHPDPHNVVTAEAIAPTQIEVHVGSLWTGRRRWRRLKVTRR